MRLLPLLLSAGLLAGCGGGSPQEDDGRTQVTAAFFPYAWLAERVGGDDVTVTALAAGGGEPHDLELSPRQVAGLAGSDLVVYSEGFMPAVDDALDQLDVAQLDAASAVELDGDADPHLWLDPQRYAEVGRVLAERLGEVDPDRAAAYEQRADALADELAALDDELRTGLADCARREVVTSHDAFGYLTARYDLQQVAVTGLVPDQQPTPGRLAEVAQLARERGVTTIFFEEAVSPATAETLAREVGARAVELGPLETPPESGDYLQGMRDLLGALRTALDCA